MTFLKKLALFLVVAMPAGHVIADDASPKFNKNESGKVGGQYRVTSIQRKADDHYVVEFTSVVKTGKHDVLILESDHLNIAVEKGLELRLSAELLTERKNGRSEVAQVLLFIPKGETHVPVWLLSRHAPARELRGSRYLEMHAPTSDYLVL